MLPQLDGTEKIKLVVLRINHNFFFNDEKKFELNGGLNPQNDRVYVKSREEANELGGIFTKQKYSLSVMVWVCMCKKGASYNFIEKGIKIDSILLQQYLE